ncbi:response regulator [Rhizobium sp. SSA_523]|uniref:response regulator n=1 Tax=Rhizobium sp. SSA_523 TaxID=2952477 RepID=UPI00209044C3|nr:response regulator [Rhizobium sp. SSA_523]MCO5733102.1 response regulator [Rhizobium sp. SSA_523]WKC23980.1 response regulator [Rhizobium sp. SSA_523]
MSLPVILVVEDEPILRMAAVDMVEAAGFDTLEAANAAQALDILERRIDIHLVFTDIDMPPGLDGLALASLIRDRWPPVHVIVTSGHTTPPQGSLPRGMIFFPKPYQEQDVVAAMQSLAA